MPWHIVKQHECPEMATAEFRAESDEMIYYGCHHYSREDPNTLEQYWQLEDSSNSHDIRSWPIVFCPFCGTRLESSAPLPLERKG